MGMEIKKLKFLIGEQFMCLAIPGCLPERVEGMFINEYDAYYKSFHVLNDAEKLQSFLNNRLLFTFPRHPFERFLRTGQVDRFHNGLETQHPQTEYTDLVTLYEPCGFLRAEQLPYVITQLPFLKTDHPKHMLKFLPDTPIDMVYHNIDTDVIKHVQQKYDRDFEEFGYEMEIE